MEKIKEIKRKILEIIKPDEVEKRALLKFYEEIKEKIIQNDREKLIKHIDLVGSVSKDTFLKNNRDLDIFIFFSKETPKDKMEEYALEIGRNIFILYNENYTIKYAEHPYVKGSIKGYEIEIVPAYHLNPGDKIISAVDRTPFHKRYILENLKNPDEVRILKKFMKSIGVYGSELYVRGFSGYACELFIIKYKSFENFLEAALSFKKRDVLCIEECDEIEYRKKFKDDAFIFVDPVDSNRNVCSSVSLENLAKLKLYARYFLSYPSLKFFMLDEMKLSKQKIKEKFGFKDKYWFVAEFENKEGIIKDILYPQLEKFRKWLLYEYNRIGFKVERSFSYIDDNTYGIYFEFDFLHPSKLRVVKGPSLFVKKERVSGFINKYEVFWINSEGNLNAYVKRDFSPEEIIFSLKTKSEEERRQQGVPKNISKDFSTLKIIKDIVEIKNEDFFRRFLPDSERIKWAIKNHKIPRY